MFGVLRGDIMAYIKDDVLNEIRSKADIVDIIGSYLDLKPKGKNYVAICPFHEDHSPSLTVSPERQIFNCFTCRTGGNVFTFVMKYENVTFPEAVEIIAKKIGYDLKLDNYSKVIEEKNQADYNVMEFASMFYQNNIMTKEGIKARSYLSDRGITEDIIKEFHIGLAPSSPDDFYKIATNKKYSLEILDKLGLINKVGLNIYDTFTNRIMIPIENLKGQIVGFTGRIFNNEEDTAKYLNTKETEIFKKGNILFNYHNARNYIRESKQVIVVEGNMDAIKLSASGIKNVVALMGVALSNIQIETLKKLKVPIILMLDNDAAGENATIKNGELLLNAGVNPLVVRLSGAKDPDEYIRANGVDALRENIKHAHKYIDFKLEYLKKDKDLTTMEDIIIYIKEVINSLNSQDDLTKATVIAKISKDYGIDADILKKEINVVPQKEEKKEKVEPIKVEKKVSKYHRLSHKVLYYMLTSSKYISIYKTRLGYFKERDERVLASEIVYYNDEIKEINIADFMTYIMPNERIYNLLEVIISENNDSTITDEEYELCIKSILNIYKIEEREELKSRIKSELDENKKMELMQKLAEIKKEV